MFSMHNPTRFKRVGSKGKMKQPSAPWAFNPANADQRTAPTAVAGDYYGTGYKAKVGKIRSDTVGYTPVNRKQMGTPPRSTA